MKINHLIATILFLLASKSAFAGLYSSNITFSGLYPSNYDPRSSVIASVEIEGKGIRNLVVSIQFLEKPFNKREYASDEYGELINRLSVEWRGVALKKVLESNKYKITDLSELEDSVDVGVKKLINQLKRIYGVKEGIEVVYSISSFYLLDPSGN